VPAIEGHQSSLAEPFGCGDDRGVDCPQWEVPIGAREFGDADPVGGEDRFGDQVPRREIAEKADLGIGTETGAEQVDDLGDDEDRDDEWPRMGLQKLEALPVMPVITIDVGVERPGIDDQGDQATSDRRICSICSDTSDMPLRPAPAASSRRRPLPPPPR
jgi:hypothetical protein